MLDEAVSVLARGGGIDGRHYQISDLIPDGLHPSPIAAEYIAREMALLVPSMPDSYQESALS